MPGLRDPARAARDRLLRAERLARARAEAATVEAGVAETVALSRARGSAIAEPEGATRRGPYRRQAGLDWLAKRGRIDPDAHRAGLAYGWAWRLARGEASIASTLGVAPDGGGGGGGPPLAQVLARAEAAAAAHRRLEAYRQKLSRQADLIAACDQICGAELTPREAAAGDREAVRLEALVKVALDILAG